MRDNVIRSDTLTLLELEHERLGQILAVLESEAEEMALSDHHRHGLIDQCLSYMLEYPDVCHHPKEDLIARRLRDGGADQASDLEHDHALLRDLTMQTIERFHAQDSTNARRSLYLREFVQAYRNHIEYENRTFFPHALSALSQSEFDEIDFSLFDSIDPVFDREHEQQFAELRNRILAFRPT